MSMTKDIALSIFKKFREGKDIWVYEALQIDHLTPSKDGPCNYSMFMRSQDFYKFNPHDNDDDGIFQESEVIDRMTKILSEYSTNVTFNVEDTEKWWFKLELIG